MPNNPYYQYRIWNIATGAIRDPMPFTQAKFGRKLNDSGSFTANLQITDPEVQKFDWVTATNLNQNLLAVDYQGVIVWAGIINTRQWDSESPNPGVLKIGASEWAGYHKQRLQAQDYALPSATSGLFWDTAYRPFDARKVAAQIIFDIYQQAFTRGDTFFDQWFGFTVGDTPSYGLSFAFSGTMPSGDYVNLSFPITQLQTVDEIVSDLTTMGYGPGFDFSIEWYYQTVDSVLQPDLCPLPTFQFWWPAQGRTVAETGLGLRRQQMIGFKYDEDGTQQANGIAYQTAGGGGGQAVEFDTASLGYGNIVLEATVSSTEINSIGQAAAAARGEIAVSGNPIVTPVAKLPLPTVTNPNRLSLADFIVGDQFKFQFDPMTPGSGLNSDPRFPNGLDFTFRNNQWDATVNDVGVGTLELTFGLVPSGSTSPTPAPTD